MTHSSPANERPHEAPEWLWYGEVDGKPVVTFGRWPKSGAVWRYKWADIQPTEHDHPRRAVTKPFAFAVRRAPENGDNEWRLFLDEGKAREAAEQLDGDYEGLYRVCDRLSTIDGRDAAYKRAWDAYVETSMDSGNRTFDCIKAAVDAALSIRAQQMRWRPMEDAPRDGTPILIRRHNDVCWDYFVAWHVTGDDKYPWHSDNNAYPEHRCDDWMAIPDTLPECGGSA